MNPEIKAEWVTLLRSGDYQQTHGTLHNDDGYCCLGVLYEAAGLCFWTRHDAKMQNAMGDQLAPRHYYTNDWDIGTAAFAYPTADLLEKTGVTYDQSRKLAYMNDAIIDDKYTTFSEIADYIEREL